MSFRSSFLSLLGLVSLSMMAPKAVHGQSAVLAEIYGRGVHAFNSGQYQKAGEWLSMAIDNGYRDPRAYYFRGLTAAASGRGYEAESDFQEGAKLEAGGSFGISSVGRSHESRVRFAFSLNKSENGLDCKHLPSAKLDRMFVTVSWA